MIFWFRLIAKLVRLSAQRMHRGHARCTWGAQKKPLITRTCPNTRAWTRVRPARTASVFLATFIYADATNWAKLFNMAAAAAAAGSDGVVSFGSGLWTCMRVVLCSSHWRRNRELKPPSPPPPHPPPFCLCNGWKPLILCICKIIALFPLDMCPLFSFHHKMYSLLKRQVHSKNNLLSIEAAKLDKPIPKKLSKIW